jgi:hypothetical protein
VNGCVGSEPNLVVTRTEGMCETHTECDDGIEVMLCSVVGDDFAGTPLEYLAGHMPYANDDFDITAEGWGQISRFETDQLPLLVPEPTRVL